MTESSINGDTVSLPDVVTYADIVRHAGLTGTPSVTYRRNTLIQPSGILHRKSEPLKITTGVRFSVAHTGNA